MSAPRALPESRLVRGRPWATIAAAIATMTASLTLLPLFEGPGFLPSVAAVVMAVGVVGFLCRAVGLPAITHPIATALAWLTMLTWLFVLPAATWWVLPGPGAIDALRILAQGGLADAETLAPPVPQSPALVLLAAGGVGLIAIAVDAIGVTLRLPAVAGAPLLVLASLPIAVTPAGLPWWLLPIGASGWLGLLAVDARASLLAWGPIAGRSRPRPSAGPQAHQRPARVSAFDPRILAAGGTAVAIALLAPLAIPGLGEPVWGTGRGASVAGGISGGDGQISLDPFVSLRRSLVNNSSQEVLSYTTDAATPGYLRMVTLTQFDGDTWRPAETSVRLPLTQPLPPPVREEGTQVAVNTYAIEVGDLINPQLPVPFAATSIRGDLSDRWTWEPATRTVSGQDVEAAGSTYTVTAYDVQPTRDQLRAATGPTPAELQALTSLPGDLTPQVGTLAEQVTRGVDSPYRQALALEKWFTVDGGFTYSTSLEAGAGDDPVAAFLTERIGYCEQFAASMALMARSLGIPARVNVGFTSGTQNTDGTWSVRGRNAHAWPELWFDGLGWVWFEPTPRSDGEAAGVVAPSYSDVPDRATQFPADDPLPTPPPVDVDPGVGPNASGSLPWWWIPILLVIAVGALGPPGIRALRRRRRTEQADPVMRIEGAWAEFVETVDRFGLRPPRQLTPRDYVTWMRSEMVRSDVTFDGPSRDAVLRLLWWIEQARYAPELAAESTPSPQHLRTVLAAISPVVARSRPMTDRVRAWWDVRMVRTSTEPVEITDPVRGLARVGAASDPRDGP